jgi:hypothetical protein
MPSMPILTRPVSPEELATVGWENALNDPSATTWVDLHSRLVHASSESEPESLPREVLALLDCAICMRLQPRMGNRFTPRQRNGNTSTGGPQNLGPDDVECLLAVARQMDIPWARAKVADVAYVAGRELRLGVRESGMLATSSYLEACSADPHPWYILPWLQRGLSLSRQFSPKEAFPAFWACLQSRLAEAIETHHLGNAFGLAEEVLDFRQPTDLQFGPIFESLAESLSTAGTGDCYTVAQCLEVAARFWSAEHHAEEANRCELAAGDVFCRHAELPNISSVLSAEWLADGIRRLQRAKADRARILKLKDQLAEIRARIPGEMKEFFYTFDGTGLAAHVERAISSDQPLPALLQLAFHTSNLPSFDRTRRQVMEDAVGGIRDHLSSTAYNDHGEPVDQRSALSDGGEERIYAEMVDTLARWWTTTHGSIVAQVSSEVYGNRFSPNLRSLIQLAHNSRAVPDGHEVAIAKGILSGFNGDWHDVGAFLIPQVEAVVRNIIKKRGGITLTEKAAGGTTRKKYSTACWKNSATTCLARTLHSRCRC